jgi:hypothetical protein
MVTALVMNFITHDAAYALFPNATFLRRTCLVLWDGMKESSDPNCIYNKYSSRGFNVPTSQHTLTHSGICFDETTSIQFGDRFIRGKSSWIIPFDTAELVQPNDTNDGVYSSSAMRNYSFSLLPDELPHHSSCDSYVTRNPPDDPSDVPVILFKNVRSRSLGGNIVLSPKIYDEITGLAQERERSDSGKDKRDP